MSPSPGSKVGAGAVRYRYLLIIVAATLAAVLSESNVDWGMLVQGGRSILFGAGLHTYAQSPYLQAGPPSLLAAAALGSLGVGGGSLAMHLLLVAVPPLSLYIVERGARSRRMRPAETPMLAPNAIVVTGVLGLTIISQLVASPRPLPVWIPLGIAAACGGCWFIARRSPRPHAPNVDPAAARVLLIGLPAAVAWGSLAGGGHIDDGFAMLALAAAITAVNADRPLLVGLLLGIAVACKPWAIVGWPLLLALPRARLRSASIALAVPALCWLPFVLADGRTLATTGYGFTVYADSTVRLLGLHSALAPGWLRGAEMAVALVASLVAARRDGWESAVAAGMVARLVLDPAVFDYYASSTVLACVLADVLRRRPPWRSALVWLGLWAAPGLLPASWVAPIRACALFVLIVSYVVPKRAARPEAGVSEAPASASDFDAELLPV